MNLIFKQKLPAFTIYYENLENLNADRKYK